MANKPLFNQTLSGTVNDDDRVAHKESGTVDEGTRNRLASVWKTYFQGTLPADIASAQAELDALGTAADADLTTSATDTTAGRVMKVGDFGLGTNDIPDYAGDIDTLLISGNWTIGATSTGTKPSTGSTWIFEVSTNNLNGAIQLASVIYSATDSGRRFIREYRTAAGWGSWYEILTTKNYPSDTAWTSTTTLLNGWTGTVQYIKRAGMVTIICDNLNGSSASSTQFLSIGASYRPAFSAWGVLRKESTTDAIRFVITTTGALASETGAGITGIYGSITYPVIT